MRVKNFFSVTFFLAAASLGFALPKNSTEVSKTPAKNSTEISKTPTKLPTEVPKGGSTPNTDAVTQLQSALAASGGVSPGCASALVTVATNPEVLQCLPLAAFLPLLQAVSDPNLVKNLLADPKKTYKEELEKPLLSYAGIICGVKKCSDKVILDSVNLLADKCKDDLTTNQFIRAVFTGLVFYSPLLDSSCFKDKSNFCFDESILALVSLPPSPFKITGTAILDSIAVADPNTVCTKCNKQIVDTFFNYLGDTKNPLNPTALKILSGAGIGTKELQGATVAGAVKCGASFVDGKIPK